LKEKIAERLTKEKEKIAKPAEGGKDAGFKETMVGGGGHYTHTQNHLAWWEELRKDTGKGKIWTTPVYMMFLAIHAAGLPFVAPVSALRARFRDPEIFFKRIAGKIVFSNLGPLEKIRLAEEVARNLREEAADIRGVAGFLKHYYQERYGKIESEEEKRPDASLAEKISGRKKWSLQVGRQAKRLFESSLNHTEHAEEMLEIVRKNRAAIINGEFDEVPASKPHLWYYNAHLQEIAGKPAEKREVHVDRLIENLEEIAKSKGELEKAHRELREFIGSATEPEKEEKRDQKLEH